MSRMLAIIVVLFSIIFELTKLPARCRIIMDEAQKRSNFRKWKKIMMYEYENMFPVPCIVNSEAIAKELKKINLTFDKDEFYLVPVHAGDDMKYILVSRIPELNNLTERIAFNRALIYLENRAFKKLIGQKFWEGRNNISIPIEEEMEIDKMLSLIFGTDPIIEFLTKEQEKLAVSGIDTSGHKRRITKLQFFTI